jgi:hypothetical protein
MGQGRQGLEITIEPSGSRAQGLILLVWLAGWAFGEWAIIRELQELLEQGAPEDAIMVGVFLVAWTIAGIMAVRAFLLSLGGRERIRINATELEHRIEAPIVGATRRYDMNRIRNLRAGTLRSPRADSAGGRPVGGSVAHRRKGRRGGSRRGRISFDYDGKLVSMGGGLSREEAVAIVEELHSRFRHLAPAATIGNT